MLTILATIIGLCSTTCGDQPASLKALQELSSGGTIFYIPPVGHGKHVQRVVHLDFEGRLFEELNSKLNSTLPSKIWKAEPAGAGPCWIKTNSPGLEDRIVLASYVANGKLHLYVEQFSSLSDAEISKFERRHSDAALRTKTYTIQIRRQH